MILSRNFKKDRQPVSRKNFPNFDCCILDDYAQTIIADQQKYYL